MFIKHAHDMHYHRTVIGLLMAMLYPVAVASMFQFFKCLNRNGLTQPQF